MPRLRLSLWFVSICLCLIEPAQAEQWPGWRGPRGDGSSFEKNVPTEWDGPSGKNIAWKTRLPGIGHGSPIVWDNKLFLLSCLEHEQERVVLCIDTVTGRTIWQRSVLRAPLETKHKLNSFASSTPVTDGQFVYVTFLEVGDKTIPARNVSKQRPVTPGKINVAAFDFAGKKQWQVAAGDFVSVHGFCSSPIVHGDLLIINGDHDGDSYIVALDKTDGRQVWKKPRAHQTRSYATPIIREVQGRTQLVFSGSKTVTSLDPRDGSMHWQVNGPTEQFVASMVFDGNLFYVAAGFPTHHVMAIRPDGRGDVTDSHIAWHETNAKCYVPSPVVVGDYLLVADDRGTANCYDTATGKRLWQARLGNHFSASLVTAGGRVYFLADDGSTKIVEPGPTLQIVAENDLGEYCFASPAISSGSLYLRGESHLYCVASDSK